MRELKLYLICPALGLLAGCGETELYLYRPDAITPDIIVNVQQVSGAPWTAHYEKGPRDPDDFLPLGDTISLRLHAQGDGHTMYIPELGVKQPTLAGQVTQSWIAVRKPISAKVLCEQHPQENTHLTLRFK